MAVSEPLEQTFARLGTLFPWWSDVLGQLNLREPVVSISTEKFGWRELVRCVSELNKVVFVDDLDLMHRVVAAPDVPKGKLPLTVDLFDAAVAALPRWAVPNALTYIVRAMKVKDGYALVVCGSNRGPERLRRYLSARRIKLARKELAKHVRQSVGA